MSRSGQRWSVCASDLTILQNAFHVCPRPSMEQVLILKENLNARVTVRNIKVWFQNRRQRNKAKFSEIPCIPSCPSTENVMDNVKKKGNDTCNDTCTEILDVLVTLHEDFPHLHPEVISWLVSYTHDWN